MVGMINTFVSRHATHMPAVESRQPSGSASVGEASVAGEQPVTSSSVSTLARQLSDAARRAELRDSTLGYKELGEKARSIVNSIVGEEYHAIKAKHRAEVPATEDEHLLARARQATAYLLGAMSNPFKGLSRDQLALITYDEGGDFTVDERAAAWGEAYDQEQAWRLAAIQKASAEYEATGAYTSFFEAVLSHYEGLPAIERAQYSKHYADDLRQKASTGADYKFDDLEGLIIEVFPRLDKS